MTLSDTKSRVQITYDAAADFYDHPALSFWPYFGARTVEFARLNHGDAVLDVCCGSGASAIPAARSVWPGGSVLAVDVSEGLVRLARAKTARLGLNNLEVRHADFASTPLPVGGFDAVLCGFGIFFFTDIPAALRKMWRLLRPGGRLVITTWGPQLFEPANTIFWNAVLGERPDLYKSFNSWETVTEPRQLRQLFTTAGMEAEEIRLERRDHAIQTPEDWWTIVMGSGYRGTVEQLGPDASERVRQLCSQGLRRSEAQELRLSVVYGFARKT